MNIVAGVLPTWLPFLQDSLREADTFQVSSSLTDLMEHVSGTQPQIVFLDGSLDPQHWIGEQVTRLVHGNPHVQIAVIGASEDGPLIYDLLERGARGYLVEGDVSPSSLRAALATLTDGKVYLSRTANSAYIEATRAGCHEFWVDQDCYQALTLLSAGYSITDISSLMQVKRWQVYRLLKRLRLRFDASTNALMLLRAAALGYVRVQP